MSIAEKIIGAKTDYDEVYEAGYGKGKSEGGDTEAAYNEGFEAGKQEEYTHFWKVFLDLDDENNPQRKEFDRAFSRGWDDTTYKIPENIGVIKPTSANSMYQNTANLMQIGKRFETEKFDFSRCENMAFCFNSSPFTEIKNIDVGASSSNNGYMFAYARATSISVKGVDEFTTFYRWFIGCESLKDLEITGTICDDFELGWSLNLSKDSIYYTINALNAYTTGHTVTLHITAVNKAFETAEGKRNGSSSEEWKNLVATKPNWTISLVYM